MAEKKYRVAVVGGAGAWGRHYLRTFAEHPDCQVVALVDRARERREQFAERYGVERTWDTVEEMLADQVPDIVSAVVPVGQNYPVVRACAEAGVRVVSCEKPISSVLSEADEMVELCRRHGTLFACAQAAWSTPHMRQVVEWVHAGHIGTLTGVAIPGGLPVELSGAGCVQLAALRIATWMEVEWVEGWELPMVEGYVAPGTAPIEADVPAYGRIGLSGGIVCEVARPEEDVHHPCFLTLVGDRGRAWLSRPHPVLVQGEGALETPVFPDFLQEEGDDFFGGTIQRLLDAFDLGEEPLSSGDDYRHSLETAIAFKLSAASGHQRVELPLEDRSHRLLPHPYRLFGGDVAGWQSIGYSGPPLVPMELRAIASFEELQAVSWPDMRRLMREIDPADLALSAEEESRLKKVIRFLPGRLRGAVQQALDANPNPSNDEMEAAKKRIVELAHRL